MALATRCLGDRRREWAAAMQGEFDAASEDGRPLAFSAGCLWAAWRELPTHEEGRYAIGSHILSFVLLVPTAALLASSIFADFPLSYLRQAGLYALPGAIGRYEPFLSDGNRAAISSLAVLVALLAALHLRLAWLVLERDWTRVVNTGTMLAAVTATLVIFTAMVFADHAATLAHAAVLAVELAAIAALERWHTRTSASECLEISTRRS